MTPLDERLDRSHKRRRLTARAIALLVIAFLALMLGASSLPAACGSCHVMRPYVASWTSSPHASVSCYACHLPAGSWSWPGAKAREVVEMYPAAAVGATLTAPGDRISSAACLACHTSIFAGTVERRGLKIAHATCAVGAACDTCHTGVSHGTRVRWNRWPDMDDCVACHLQRSATIACDACHVRRTQARRLASVTLRATHGPTWPALHGRGELTLCRTCHATGFCVGCHGIVVPHPSEFANVHGGYSRVESARCGECHDRTTYCDACHGVPMPHAKDYLKSHSHTTKGLTDQRCTLCHDSAACVACHKMHTHAKSTKGTIGTFELPAMKP